MHNKVPVSTRIKYRLRYIMRRPTSFVSVAAVAQTHGAQLFKRRSDVGLSGPHRHILGLIELN